MKWMKLFPGVLLCAACLMAQDPPVVPEKLYLVVTRSSFQASIRGVGLVGSGTGAVARRLLQGPGSSSRHITRSGRISRTTRSCTVHDKGDGAYRGGAAQKGGASE
jgi:hypothetical protein